MTASISGSEVTVNGGAGNDHLLAYVDEADQLVVELNGNVIVSVDSDIWPVTTQSKHIGYIEILENSHSGECI